MGEQQNIGLGTPALGGCVVGDPQQRTGGIPHAIEPLVRAVQGAALGHPGPPAFHCPQCKRAAPAGLTVCGSCGFHLVEEGG
ncbi:hypothetical protein QF030_000836 [Streptomyces rishiriensis]|uniref:Zinc ribbon domain-containing protein n=1 Tax=Streptomyces rishiriensis TaxID=68264 RepID=A0ABU0NHR8_STRRH|nr:hypothetical protein [Streptomyces rishiriensis]